MIDGLKKLLTGVLSFLIGLFSGKKAQENKQIASGSVKTKKRSGYFMELDESEDPKFLSEPVAAVKQAVEKTKNATVEAAKQVVETVKTSEPVAVTKQTVEKVKSPEPAAKAIATTEPVTTKTSKVELVQTAEGLKAEPAKPSKSVAESNNGQNKTETTFAPKYLNPAASSTNRRRPGANMTNFLDMASQVNSPAKS